MQSQRGAAVILLLLAFAACVCRGQEGSGDGWYGDMDLDNYSYGDDANDYFTDDSGYYGSDDKLYYDYHGYYPDEYEGYTAYDDEDYAEYRDCSFNDKGKPELRNGTTSCPVKIAGVDKQADGLQGGVDGLYDLVSCYNGKPLYRRRNSTKTGSEEGRVLWYSDIFGDWDVSRGSDPDESKIIMYGGEREFAALPLLVSKWHLHSPSAKPSSPSSKDDYKPIKVQITCADGTKLKAKEVEALKRLSQDRQPTGPMLTADELDKKYKQVYDAFGRRPEPNPAVSFTFVVLLVMIGLTIVLAIPFFLVKKKPNGKASISTSFSQMLQQSKKKQSGHAN